MKMQIIELIPKSVTVITSFPTQPSTCK